MLLLPTTAMRAMARNYVQGAPNSGALLNMGFQEPERFVQIARCSGKNVGGIRISRLGRLVDTTPQPIGDGTVTFDQRREMILNGVDVGGIRGQGAYLRHRLRRAERGAAQLHDALGHGV